MYLFSVIVPCFNAEKHINRFFQFLEKVSNLDKIEIIFVDDASSDKTYEIIKNKILNYKNMKLIKNKDNKGPGGALNAGLKIISTSWFFRLDIDDVMLPSYVDEIRKKLSSDVLLIRFKFNFYKNKIVKKPNMIEALYFKIAFSWSVGFNLKLYGIPKFKENFKMEDMEQYGRYYIANGKEIFINKPLVIYTVDGKASIMNNLNTKTINDWKIAFSEYSKNKNIKGIKVFLYKKYIKRKIYR